MTGVVTCPSCMGNKFEYNSPAYSALCSYCNGEGEVLIEEPIQTCPVCMDENPHTHDKNRWIGVDFDGTLSYDRPDRNSPYSLGQPIERMVERVKFWIRCGYTVKLLTARMNPISHCGGEPRDIKKMEKLLHEWCEKYIGTRLECVAGKDGFMEVLWDDRVVHVIRDTGNPAKYYKTQD